MEKSTEAIKKKTRQHNKMRNTAHKRITRCSTSTMIKKMQILHNDVCHTYQGKKIQSENSKCWRICGEQWECLCTAGGSKNCYSLLENNTARSNLKICSPFDLAISLPIYPREIFPHMHQEYFTKKYLQHQYLKEPQVETTQMSPTNKMEKYILVYH